MKTKVSILFTFRRSRHTERESTRIPADEEGRLICRITAHGKDVHISTHMSVAYGEWDSAAQRVKGKSRAASTINAALTKMLDELTDIWADLERQKRPVTAQAIVRLYKTDGSPLDMLALYGEFLTERERLVDIEISYASYQVAKTRQGILLAFVQAHSLTDMRPEDFTHNMADKMLYWMLKDRGFKRNYANKVLQSMNQCLRWGVRRELLVKNPMELYRFKAAAVSEIKYLTVGELHALSVRALPHPYLERVRDCFVFQCWTGLAYADLAALNLERDAQYHRDSNNILRRVLHVTRAKSTVAKGYECVIPLLPEAERILAKYDDNLPVVSNVRYNAYLKDLGRLCHIGAEKMTTHVGRKTAGVMMLNLGLRMETVSKFLGHSSIKMTEKIYAKILDSTVVDEFSALFGGAPIQREAPTLQLLLPTPAELIALPVSPELETELAEKGQRQELQAERKGGRPVTRKAARIPATYRTQLDDSVPTGSHWRTDLHTTTGFGSGREVASA